jgi:hypothetical protein
MIYGAENGPMPARNRRNRGLVNRQSPRPRLSMIAASRNDGGRSSGCHFEQDRSVLVPCGRSTVAVPSDDALATLVLPSLTAVL